MRALVLGSAAGGGFPQWNCRCSVCLLAWQGSERVRRRTQSSVAVTANGTDWALLNCSPDIREQIGANRPLWPARGLRHSPISDVVLTNGDIDHAGGLLSLRERWPLTIHATAEVGAMLRANPMLNVLADPLVEWRDLRPGKAFAIGGGLEAEAFPVPGKVPLYMERDGEEPDMRGLGDTTIGLSIRDADGARLVYVPGCAGIDAELRSRIQGAGALLFDGTLFRDDEMILEGVGRKSGRRMGHMPIAEEGGSLAALTGVDVGRRIYIHINNTNPVLVEGSAQRSLVEAAGWEIATDGMELLL